MHTQHLCVCSGSCSGGLDFQISCTKLSSASQAVPEVVVNVGAWGCRVITNCVAGSKIKHKSLNFMVELHPGTTEPLLYFKMLLIFQWSSNKGLQGFMMMVVIKIATDVTVSSQPLLDLYCLPFSGRHRSEAIWNKSFVSKEVCWYLLIQLAWNRLLLNQRKCLLSISIFFLITN